MKLINQLGIILGLWLLGELLSNLIRPMIQIPGSIIGMVLLMLALTLDILKESQIKELGDLLLGNISFFFIPASVGILAVSGIDGLTMVKLVLIAIVSTIVTMTVTMLVTDALIKKRK